LVREYWWERRISGHLTTDQKPGHSRRLLGTASTNLAKNRYAVLVGLRIHPRLADLRRGCTVDTVRH
jgi:hypothetical protein